MGNQHLTTFWMEPTEVNEWFSIAGFNDPMSSISHLVGAVFFFAMSIVLMVVTWRNRTAFWFCLEFEFATVFLLSMSFVFHMLPIDTTARAVMLRLDVAAIFVLIASTFTVIHGILFRGWRGWAVILVIWIITVLGITLRTIFFDTIPMVVGDGIFLLLGWVGLYSAYLLWKEYRWAAVVPVALGGLFYTVGAVMNSTNWPVVIDRVWGPHECFHLFVLAGLWTHWRFVWRIADGSFQRQHVHASRQATVES